MKSVDLTVDLLALLAAGAVLLLEIFIPGQFVFQTELTVILLLVGPLLKGVDAFGADLDDLVDHAGRSLRGGNNAVFHTDCQALTHILTQMDELTGRRVAVQRFLSRIQRGKAQTAARSGRSAQLGVDAVHKSLADILASLGKRALRAVDGGHRIVQNRGHSRLDGAGVVPDSFAESVHHLYNSGVHRRSLLVHHVCQGTHDLLHCRVGDSLIAGDGGFNRVQHDKNGAVDFLTAIRERIGETVDAAIRQGGQRFAEVGESVLIDILDALGKIHEPPDLGDDAGHLSEVNSGDLIVVITHSLAERGNIVAERGESLVPSKPLVEEAAVRKTGCQIGKCLRRVGRSCHRVRLDIFDSCRIGRKVVTEENEVVSKIGNVVVAGKEANQPSAVRDGFRQLHKCFAGGGGIGYGICVQTFYRQRVRFDGVSEAEKLRPESVEVVFSGEETDHAAAVWNGVCQLHHSLTGGGGVCNSVYIQALDSQGIVLDGFAKGDKLLAKGGHIVLAGEEADHASTVRERRGHFSHGLTGNRGVGYSIGVHALDFVREVDHRVAKCPKLISKGLHVVLSGEETDNPTAVRKRRGHFSQSLASNRSLRNEAAVHTGNRF